MRSQSSCDGHPEVRLLARSDVVEPTREIGLVASPVIIHRGQSGVAKSAARSVYGATTAWPKRTRLRLEFFHRGSRSMYARQGVLPVPRLVDRVDDPSALSGADDPRAALDPEVTALDLDDHDADVGHEDDEVELMVLLLVSEPDVGEHRPVVCRPS